MKKNIKYILLLLSISSFLIALSYLYYIPFHITFKQLIQQEINYDTLEKKLEFYNKTEFLYVISCLLFMLNSVLIYIYLTYKFKFKYYLPEVFLVIVMVVFCFFLYDYSLWDSGKRMTEFRDQFKYFKFGYFFIYLTLFLTLIKEFIEERHHKTIFLFIFALGTNIIVSLFSPLYAVSTSFRRLITREMLYLDTNLYVQGDFQAYVYIITFIFIGLYWMNLFFKYNK